MTAQAISTTANSQLMEASSMQIETTSSSAKRLWAGRILSGLPTLFLLVDGGMKLFKPPVVVESTLQLAIPNPPLWASGSYCWLVRSST